MWDRARRRCEHAWLAAKGYDPLYGARPLAQVIQDQIKRPLADELLFGKLAKGGKVFVTTVDDKLAFHIAPVGEMPLLPAPDGSRTRIMRGSGAGAGGLGGVRTNWEAMAQPDVEAFFDEATNTVSYVAVDAATGNCAVIDSVLDFDPVSGRTDRHSADRMIDFVRRMG